jgi:hypothetical protein
MSHSTSQQIQSEIPSFDTSLGRQGSVDRVGRTLPVSLIASALISLVTIILLGQFAARENALSIMVLFAILGFLGIGLTARSGLRTMSLFIIPYCWTILFALFLYATYMAQYEVPYYVGGSDDFNFERAAYILRKLPFWNYGAVLNLDYNSTGLVGLDQSIGYVYFLGLLIRFGELFGGYHTMLPRIVNAFLLAMLAATTYRVALRYGMIRKVAFAVALATGLLPIMTWTSAHVFRDVFMSFSLMLVTLIWAPGGRFSSMSRIARWTMTFVLILMLSQVRLLQAVVALGVAVVSDLFVPAAHSRHSIERKVYIFAFMVLLLLCVAVFSSQIRWLWEWVVDAQGRYTIHNLEKSDGFSRLVFSAPLPMGLVLRAIYGVIVPLPIFTLELDRLWLSIGTAAQFMFLPFLAAGLVRGIKQRELWPITAAFIMLFGGAILITFTLRHIVQFLPFAAILAGFGYTAISRYRYLIWILMVALGLLLAVSYLGLRLL